jgi:hypothetical protein
MLLMFSSLRHRWPKLILAILFGPFGFIAPKDFTIIFFLQIFWFRAYLMKVIPETSRAH